MRPWRTGMVLVLGAVLALAGCGDRTGESSAPVADGAGRDQAPGAKEPAAAAPTAPAGDVRLLDLANRVIRTATVRLEVGKGELAATVSRATEIVTRHRGLYVGSSTSAPGDGPAHGEVTFRVPVAAFEPALRDLKGLGAYRGEQSSTEDVTNQYVDLKGQLASWRAQERVYLRLLDRARSISDVIAVQNQLQQVQSNIERLQGQVNYLEEQTDFSTIVLDLTEPGATPAARPRSTLARAWATAVSGLVAMAAALLVAVVWGVPLLALAALALLVFRLVRRGRPTAGAPAGSAPGAGG